MSDWNPKANEIFLDAQDCDSIAARQAFLDDACGSDRELREQVESLLKADQAAPSILDRHAAELAISSEPSVHVGTQIGPYKIRELIGEGELPVAEFWRVLSDNHYDGWITLESEKRWHADGPEPEQIFPQFARWVRSISLSPSEGRGQG